MERAGVPGFSPRRSSVEAKMQSTSCSVRKSSTVTAWPAVVLLLSWGQRRGG
uniref:Micropeptide inhibiting actin cytoskeleton n=1 Tax=Homo sapiens TaxID=9606 RepID=MIAC_HUMAN|nr:RecName: Full=Micropeptide inhibiting actin cytoskeleton [Homo sapiens]QOI14795.1 micropeptide inhibiting actin cytoskeleton [Homo sapiens]